MEMAIPPKSHLIPAVQTGMASVKPAATAAPPATSAPGSVSTPTGTPAAQPAELLIPAAEVFKAPLPLPKIPTSPAATVVAAVNMRRPASIDPLGATGQSIETTLNPFRLTAAAKIFTGFQRIQQHVGLILNTLNTQTLPPTLIGALHEPDGTAAVRVQIQFDPTTVGGVGPVTTVLTKDDGGFTIAMPPSAALPNQGLSLTVHGANANATVNVPTSQIAANGMIGVLTLPQQLAPLPVSILAALSAFMPSAPAQPTQATPPPANQPTVTIGEKGSVCVQSFAASKKTDTFPWGVFFRLVEPQMSIVTETQPVPIGPGGRFGLLPIYSMQAKALQTRALLAGTQNFAPGQNPPATQTAFVDRVPIDQPISVDAFRDQIAGIDATGTFTADETVPMAASLGLGYVLQMSQQWAFQGLGLGNLVYSLPLAPGEQQQIAVFERKDTSQVQESEFFSESEAMSQRAVSDTSTNATFNSAFNEAMQGGSHFDTSSSSWSVGGSIIIASAGGGGSSSSGNTSSWLSGQRDIAQQAAQTTHSSAENQASARLTASRTGMRLATASESMDTTTKIITNHNHTHALTMQYWEVHRIYDVTTAVDGLTLACLVPMQIVRFMPAGQPASIANPSTLNSHAAILSRYANILHHLDVLEVAVPRRFRHGLHLLAQFVADPTAMVDTSGSVAEDVVMFKLQGTFLSCETVSITAVTKRNTRVGPVRLAPSTPGQPVTIPQNQLQSRDQLTAWLILPERTNPRCKEASRCPLP